MFLAMFALLLSYSSCSWLETVRIESVEVANTMAPKRTKMPKRVFRKSFLIRIACLSGCVTGPRRSWSRPGRTWLPSR